MTANLSEAAAQLHDIKARLEAVRNDHKLLTAAVEETNRSGKKAATAEARKIVSEAQKEASAHYCLGGSRSNGESRGRRESPHRAFGRARNNRTIR